jgi:endonuclease/exonuclease/phosphatase family metal-dependent hydrolase
VVSSSSRLAGAYGSGPLTGPAYPERGARVGRGVVDLVGGGSITVVSIHASSGFDTQTFERRAKQFEQIFMNLDGSPAANGQVNVVLGDFNTDPARLPRSTRARRR